VSQPAITNIANNRIYIGRPFQYSTYNSSGITASTNETGFITTTAGTSHFVSGKITAIDNNGLGLSLQVRRKGSISNPWVTISMAESSTSGESTSVEGLVVEDHDYRMLKTGAGDFNNTTFITIDVRIY